MQIDARRGEPRLPDATPACALSIGKDNRAFLTTCLRQSGKCGVRGIDFRPIVNTLAEHPSVQYWFDGFYIDRVFHNASFLLPNSDVARTHLVSAQHSIALLFERA